VVPRNWANFGRSAWGSNFRKEVNVSLVVLAPLARKIIFVVDRFYWANWLTGAAVHAFIRVNVKHAVALIYAVDRAFINARFVFDVHTRKGDYVSHSPSLAGLKPGILLPNGKPRIDRNKSLVPKVRKRCPE
jgi:hypothetical protein